MQQDSTAHTQSGSAGDRRQRVLEWLRANVASVLIAVIVFAALFGTRALAIAVADHKDNLLTAQLLVPRAQTEAQSIVAVTQDYVGGLRVQSVAASRIALLRTQLSADVNALVRAWPHASTRRAVPAAGGLGTSAAALIRDLELRNPGSAPTQQLTAVFAYDAALAASLRTTATDLAHQTRSADAMERRVTLIAAIVVGGLLVVMIIAFALTGRRRALAEREQRILREAEERLQALVEHSSDLIVVVADDGKVEYEAGSVEAVLGTEPGQLRGRELTDWVEPGDRGQLLALCRTHAQQQDEVRLRRGDGELRSCVVRATSLRDHPGWGAVVLHIWDVSDRKELERELRLAQKLEAVGQLSAGIAHEINTPIQFVSDTNRFLDNAFADLQVVLDAYAELLVAEQQGAVTPELVRRVEEAEEIADIEYLRARIPEAFVRSFDGIQRVAKIVGAMRAFAHPPVPERSLVDVNDAVQNTLIVATNEYRYVADVVTELGDVPLVECNGSDLNQVLLNLIINAADAIVDVVGQSGERGRIVVRTESAGEDVLISVADTGAGIPAEIADRVFDPFFTTKEVGRGTGQGLTVSRSLVVERHHGTLTFETVPGEGTTFVVRLPLRSSSAPRRVAAAA